MSNQKEWCEAMIGFWQKHLEILESEKIDLVSEGSDMNL